MLVAVKAVGTREQVKVKTLAQPQPDDPEERYAPAGSDFLTVELGAEEIGWFTYAAKLAGKTVGQAAREAIANWIDGQGGRMIGGKLVG